MLPPPAWLRHISTNVLCAGAGFGFVATSSLLFSVICSLFLLFSSYPPSFPSPLSPHFLLLPRPASAEYDSFLPLFSSFSPPLPSLFPRRFLPSHRTVKVTPLSFFIVNLVFCLVSSLFLHPLVSPFFLPAELHTPCTITSSLITVLFRALPSIFDAPLHGFVLAFQWSAFALSPLPLSCSSLASTPVAPSRPTIIQHLHSFQSSPKYVRSSSRLPIASALPSFSLWLHLSRHRPLPALSFSRSNRLTRNGSAGRRGGRLRHGTRQRYFLIFFSTFSCVFLAAAKVKSRRRHDTNIAPRSFS